MPEALAAVTALQLATGLSSETDGAATDRSSTSTGVDAGVAASAPTAGKKKQLPPAVAHKKPRRSVARRGAKKPPLPSKVGSPQLKAAAVNSKSQIPRALLLTPSSSSASLRTPRSGSAETEVEPQTEGEHKPEPALESEPSSATKPPTADVDTPPTTPKSTAIRTLTPRPATPHLQLQRQHTAAILNFRIRKSVSQMEFKRTRRGANFPPPIISQKSVGIGELPHESQALVPNSASEIAAIMGHSSQSSLVNKIFDQDNYYYVIKDRDPKVAGMRIFATIMLNAWRKRRDEVKRLMEEVTDLKRGSIKAKNQLHVFNTLFRVEQKRNDELSCQLKHSLEDISNTKSSCESLTTSLISLKADKALLEQQIQIKEQEFDGLNTILTQTKSDLFKAMSQQRELQASLSSEQRKVQTLETQKNELINEICEVNTESLQKEEKLRAEMDEKDLALGMALCQIKKLEDEIAELRKQTSTLGVSLENEARLKKELEHLNAEVNTLQQYLSATLGNRLKTCWNNSISYQKATLQLLHWFVFYALPATPPPKISSFPFGLTLEKALSIVKR